MLGRNTVDGQQLLGYVERIEHINREIKSLQEDKKAEIAMAKSAGYDPAGIRLAVKARAQTPSQFREGEDLRDMYLHAVGLANEPPLFRYLESMTHDKLGKAEVIERLKEIVPAGASITVEMGDKTVRLFRDAEGKAKVEDVVPPEPQAAAPAPAPRKTEADVPDCDEAGATELGRAAARANKPIIENPFPFGDRRRARWDEGWRRETGSDGMGPSTDDDPPDGKD